MKEHKILSVMQEDDRLLAQVLIEDESGDPEDNRITHVELPAYIYEYVDEATMRTIIRRAADENDSKKDKDKRIKFKELEK